MILIKKTKFYTKIQNLEIKELQEVYKHFKLTTKSDLPNNIKWLKFFSDGCIQILTGDLDIITYNDYVDNQIMIAKFKKDLRHLVNLD